MSTNDMTSTYWAGGLIGGGLSVYGVSGGQNVSELFVAGADGVQIPWQREPFTLSAASSWALEVLIVLRCSPVTAPAPTTIGEYADGRVAVVQESRVIAAAVQIWRGVPGLEYARAVDVRIEKRVEVDGSTVGVLRPSAGSGDVSAVERRGVVVLHGQLVVGGRVVVDRADLLDGIALLVKSLEDRDHLRHQVFVHDQLAAMGLAVETNVVDLDTPQPPRFEGATRPPARAEFGGGDRVNGRSGWGWLRRGWRRTGRRRPGGGRRGGRGDRRW